MDNPYELIVRNLWVATLAVLLLPAAAALAVAGMGRAARRAAVLLAALHVVVTAGTVTLYSGFVEPDAVGGAGKLVFEPKAVPGDPGHGHGTDAATGGTALSLLPLAPADGKRVVPDVQLFLGLDGLGLLLLSLTSVMGLAAVLASYEQVTDRPGPYYAWLFALQAATVGAFLSFDLVLFYVFFELTLIPAYFLIGRWGVGGQRRDAAKKFVLYTLFGSLITLVGMVGVVLTNPVPLNPKSGMVMYWDPTQRAMNPGDAGGAYSMLKPGPVSFSIPTLMKNALSWDMAHLRAVNAAEDRLAATPNPSDELRRDVENAVAASDRRRAAQGLLFFALIAGFAVKIPIVPFHTWLPTAYAEAPAPVALLLTAVLAKLGSFALLRVVVPLLPEPAVAYGLPVFGVLGAVGIVYGAFCAFAQRDLKRLAGYSSISHLGFLVAGLFALNPEGISGAALHMVNHGLTAGALFALIGFLHRRYRSTDMNQYGGLWNKYPRYTFFVVFTSLAAVGLPGLNNFPSEMLMLAGLFDPRNLSLVGYGVAVAAAVGLFLSAWYTFSMLRKVFFGPLQEPRAPDGVAPAGDLAGTELIAAGMLASLGLALGLYPQPALDVVRPEAERLAHVCSWARLRLDPTAEPPRAPAENAPDPDRRPAVGGRLLTVPGGPRPAPAPRNPQP